MSNFKLEINNAYTYVLEGDTSLIKKQCQLKSQRIYKWSFLLKHRAADKWHINNYNLDEYRALYGKCKKHDKQYAIPMKKYMKNKNNIVNVPVFKEDWISFYDEDEDKFPTGWVFSKVIKPLQDNSYTFNIIDNRTELETSDTFQEIPLPYELRYYQKEAINLAIDNNRFICHLATGGGKTLIGMGIIKETGASSLFIVPSLSLLNQTYRNFVEVFGKKYIGKIGDGHEKIKKVTISTVQSLWSKRTKDNIQDLLSNVGVMILDEAHHVNTSKQNTNTWFQIAMQCDAKTRIGLTATPGKDNDKSFEMLKAATGKIAISKSIKQLIEEGFLCPADIFMIPIKQKQYSHWKTAVKQGIHLNEKRNRVIAKYAQSCADRGENVVITVNRIKTQATELIELLPDAYTAFGDTPSEARKQIFKELEDTRGNILISSVIGEGWDCPSASVLILAEGGKGGVNARNKIQKIGRVLRKEKDKDKALIIDFFDKDGKTLEKHSRFRYKHYKEKNAFNIYRAKPSV
ncbi:MAG: DEAD/DEAH box helicase [Halanaerobiales bacterium]|nr:DEAD/DEAH box helicase [Halanaerobiales bacterium]